jgi:8-oxo-dGTP diphosphatase
MSSKGNPGKWDLPGGKVDTGENLEQGLLREVVEETGLAISLHRVLGAAQAESSTVRIVYLLFEGRHRSGRVRLSSEHDDYMWVSQGSLPSADLAPQFCSFARMYAGGEA